MKKLIVLDWDDCITTGSSEGYYACYAAGVADAGVEKSIEEIKEKARAMWGRPHREVIASIVGNDESLVDTVTQGYEECIFSPTFQDALSLVPGAKEKIETLRENYQLAVATGMDGKLFREHVLPRFGMEHLFACVMSSSELPDPARGKPHPDMLLSILKTLDMVPEEAVMFGDAKGDVLMAQAAGVRPIVVLTGQLSLDEAKELGVETIIPDITHLDIRQLSDLPK